MTVAAAVLRASGRLDATATDSLGAVGLATGLVALAASVLHLGQPLLAWRAVLGLRRSWLSREIVAFGAFAGAGVAQTALRVAGAAPALVTAAEATTVAGGVAGVACSVQLYAVTGRRWWRAGTTAARFAGTAVACGAVATAGVLAAVDPTGSGAVVHRLLPVAAAGLALSVLAPIIPLRRVGRRLPLDGELRATRRLLGRPLQGRLLGRLAAAALGAGLLGAAAAAAPSLDSGARGSATALVAAWVALTVGEYHERRLFFLASVAPRMPGSPR
jgi:DMSO reductase anchor subunit